MPEMGSDLLAGHIPLAGFFLAAHPEGSIPFVGETPFVCAVEGEIVEVDDAEEVIEEEEPVR